MESPNLEQNVKKKIFWRIVPFIFVLYVISFLDRVNVSYASLTMSKDLHFTTTIIGLGSGIFFVGYLLFQIPVTVWVEKKSARKLIGVIVIGWGTVAAITSFINTDSQFYTLRFLLGVGEAGFLPALIIYISHWFTAKQRATITSILIASTMTAQIIGGPISTRILTIDWLNLEGWRWLFVMEGLPAVILGIVAYFYLTDRPRHAKWLDGKEKKWIEEQLDIEKRDKLKKFNYSWKQAIRQRDVITLAMAYVLWLAGAYSIVFFLPTMISELTHFSLATVGYVVALSYVGGFAGLVITGKLSDRKNEKKMHIFVPLIVGIVSLGLSVLVYPNVLLSVITLTVAVVGISAGFGVFWSLPSVFLSEMGAAVSIGIISTIGNVGGFVGPFVTGYLRSTTGSFTVPSIFIMMVLLGTAFLILSLKKNHISLQTTDA